MSAKNLKQQQVAALAKQKGRSIDQTTVGRIANGRYPATVDTLEALATGLGVEPCHLLIEGYDPSQPALANAGLSAAEQRLVADYRMASDRWKFILRYMANLRQDNDQEEVASGMNVLLAKILGAKPVSDRRVEETYGFPPGTGKREPLFRGVDGAQTHAAGQKVKKRITR